MEKKELIERLDNWFETLAECGNLSDTCKGCNEMAARRLKELGIEVEE